MARPRSEEARSKMMDAATGVIMECGVRGFSVDAVSRRSGVAKTTIYRHFSTGNELLMKALDQVIVPFPIPDNGSLREDLMDFISVVLPAFSDPALRPVMLDMLAESARDPQLAEIHQAMVEARLESVRTIFGRAKARGEIHPDIDFDTAFGMIEGPFVARWLIRPEQLQEMSIERTIDLIVKGLKG